ncbi:MAG: hypothetical protein GX877_03540 [Bacteroidales bacterium]|nr:hypothetical protein [Bacteroidales bacterium]
MKALKIIIKMLGYLLLTGALGTYFYFASVLVYKKNQERCQEVDILIKDSIAIPLTYATEVLSTLNKKGMVLPGKHFSEIDLFQVEKEIESQGAVRQCNAVKNIKGTLSLEIWQHHPLFLLETQVGTFYVTNERFVFPARLEKPLPLLTVHGNVPFPYKSSFRGYTDSTQRWLEELIPFVAYVVNDPFWKEKTKSIWVKNSEEICILPEENLILTLGDTNRFVAKMNKLREFYRVLAPRGGAEKYQVIDARFKDQLVCKQRKN